MLNILQVPSYISRSVAGSYDNEAVAIFALIFTFYLYIKVKKRIILLTNSLLNDETIFWYWFFTGYADIEHRIPFLCYFKLNCILLHGRHAIDLLYLVISLIFVSCLLKFFYLSGMLLGRIHLYYQPDTNACASLHCDWSLFISALHCICSTCKCLIGPVLY